MSIISSFRFIWFTKFIKFVTVYGYNLFMKNNYFIFNSLPEEIFDKNM